MRIEVLEKNRACSGGVAERLEHARSVFPLGWREAPAKAEAARGAKDAAAFGYGLCSELATVNGLDENQRVERDAHPGSDERAKRFAELPRFAGAVPVEEKKAAPRECICEVLELHEFRAMRPDATRATARSLMPYRRGG